MSQHTGSHPLALSRLEKRRVFWRPKDHLQVREGRV